jgi:hypothetical protein
MENHGNRLHFQKQIVYDYKCTRFSFMTWDQLCFFLFFLINYLIYLYFIYILKINQLKYWENFGIFYF